VATKNGLPSKPTEMPTLLSSLADAGASAIDARAVAQSSLVTNFIWFPPMVPHLSRCVV